MSAKRKIPEHLKPFEQGQLCYVVYRRHRGKGPYRLLLHAAVAHGKNAFAYGGGDLWVADAVKARRIPEPATSAKTFYPVRKLDDNKKQALPAAEPLRACLGHTEPPLLVDDPAYWLGALAALVGTVPAARTKLVKRKGSPDYMEKVELPDNRQRQLQKVRAFNQIQRAVKRMYARVGERSTLAWRQRPAA